jgi:hypothetical protein
VPSSERKRFGDHDLDVVAEPGINATNLRVVLLDQKPVVDPPFSLVKLESDDHSFLGEQIMPHVVFAPRPQDIVGIGMFAC